MKKNLYNQQGQTLVALLFFMVIAIMVATGASLIMIVDLVAGETVQEGQIAYITAESGIEDALMRLLRDPSYAGETLTINNGTAVVTVSGTGSYIITSVGHNGNFVRQLQVTATFTNNVMTVSRTTEIF